MKPAPVPRMICHICQRPALRQETNGVPFCMRHVRIVLDGGRASVAATAVRGSR